MALKKFTDIQGKASRSGPDRYKPLNNDNRFRIVGSLVPSYKYWVKGKDGSSVPLECLSFDRDREEFNSTLRDPVREHFPDARCSWSYYSYVIDLNDPENPKLKLFDHKKKLLGQVIDAAKQLKEMKGDDWADPADPVNGWDIYFTRKSTGPRVYDVEYSLNQFKIEQRPLTEEELALVDEAPPVDTLYKRPTAEEQDKFIRERLLADESDAGGWMRIRITSVYSGNQAKLNIAREE